MKTTIKMVITDLDGTLFNNNHEIAEKDHETLKLLKKEGIIRVIATGRNFYSANKILAKDFPIDYLIFSSGAGIYDWNKQLLIHSEYLPKELVKKTSEFLINEDVDFMVHEIIPDNHKFIYHHTGKRNPDFERRYKLYQDFAEPMDASAEEHEHASQIIVIPDKDESYYNQLSQKLPEVKCIRTTSPLDKETLWIEIFPKNVSKGHGVAWLCDYTQTDPTKTVGIGNDYNDLDLLDFTTQSFVVANAPDELQQQYSTCNSNTSCGFTDAIMKALDLADQE